MSINYNDGVRGSSLTHLIGKTCALRTDPLVAKFPFSSSLPNLPLSSPDSPSLDWLFQACISLFNAPPPPPKNERRQKTPSFIIQM